MGLATALDVDVNVNQPGILPSCVPALECHANAMNPKASIEDGTACAYCGGIAEHKDHVIPVSLLRPGKRGQRFQDDDWIVPACVECNGLLSDRMLHTVPLRASWLYKEYRRRYKKLLTAPTWSNEELDELGDGFRSFVIENMIAQAELDLRLAKLRWVSRQDMDYMHPKKRASR